MSALRLSPCLELLFAEGDPPFAERVRMASEAGCDAVEFWGWRNKPLDAIAEAVEETGLKVAMVVIDPGVALVDPARRWEFMAGVRDAVDACVRIGSRCLTTVSGAARPGASDADQDEAIVAALREAAPIAADRGVTLLLEPLNTRKDHPGTYLSGTTHGLDLVERVGRPEVRLLYDVYHSATMGEDPAAVLDGRGELVGHVHVADTEGRNEPGTGGIDWPQTMTVLRDVGYTDFVGLEYLPTAPSAASVRAARDAIEQP